MNYDLLNFAEFSSRNRLFEANKSKAKTGLILTASNPAEKARVEDFVAQVASTFDPKEMNELLDDIIDQGQGLAAKLGTAMEKRKELDSGPLTKKGDFYVGEGAWRINSAKFAKMGLTPPIVQYYDPAQESILAKYFAEDDKSDVSVGADGEIEGMEMDYEDPTQTGVETEKEKEEDYEYAMAESSGQDGMKYLNSIYEQGFSVGPSESATVEAVIVDASQLSKELIDNYMYETRENMMIWGAPGIGKTQIVKAVAKSVAKELGLDEEEVPVVIITLATKQSYDISGIPFQTIESDLAPDGLNQNIVPGKFRGEIGMDFAYPAWLPGPNDNRGGILFFDEINRADVDTMGAALSLLLDRVSGSYTMPDEWRIWAAGNRGMDGPVKPFEGAMASRFLGGHLHLVPTVEGWSKWARTDSALFSSRKGGKNVSSGEYYIPGEFLSFINLRDVQDGGEEIMNLGRKFRVKFEYFYNWGESDGETAAEGKSTGFPNPRTWTKAFSNVYQVLRRNASLMSKVSPKTDPKERVISMLGIATLDPAMRQDITTKIGMVVGVTAAEAFITFVEQLSRLNDSEGTLVEKIDNVFDDPNKPRPLMNIDKLGLDEVYGVLSTVHGKFTGLIDKMTVEQFTNWQQYIMDLGDAGKADPGVLQAHVIVITTQHLKLFVPLTRPSNPGATPATNKIQSGFSARYKEYMQQISAL